MSYLIIWPQRRYITADELIGMAQDDIANGDCGLPEFDDPTKVLTAEDAYMVLQDSGTVTFGRRS